MQLDPGIHMKSTGPPLHDTNLCWKYITSCCPKPFLYFYIFPHCESCLLKVEYKKLHLPDSFAARAKSYDLGFARYNHTRLAVLALHWEND